MRVQKRDAVYALAACAMFVLGRTLRDPPEVRYQRVEVPVEVIIKREPDTIVTFVERIKYVNVPAAQVAVASGGGLGAVAEFCKPVTVTARDTVEVQPTLLLRSVSVDKAWWTGSDKVLFTGLVSNGDMVAADYSVAGDWVARTNADSLMVRRSRVAWLSGAMEFLIPLTAGILIQKLF